MFTGIVQSVATIIEVYDSSGIRSFTIEFDPGFCQDLEIGASVSVDGVCLTVTTLISDTHVKFDVMLQSLLITTLSAYEQGSKVNVERAAKDGAEIGGHPLSGHVDFKTDIKSITHAQDNYCIRFSLPESFKRYIFAKGYIAINGASLTVAEVNKIDNWFEVWLIPETRRMTVFELKTSGDMLNIEIERGTQVVVDTVRDTIEENLGALFPMFEKLLIEQGVDINALGTPQKKTKKLS